MQSRLKQLSACLLMLRILLLATPAVSGVTDEPCPPSSISLDPGTSIQAAVEGADEGAAFCLKNGVHRVQVIRPKRGQSFYGEGQTILNGSRLLTSFSQEERYWVASGQEQHGRQHGVCAREHPACGLPEGLFIDDKPLVQVLNKEEVDAGKFYFDHGNGRIYFADDPRGRKVEATVGVFAFESRASNVLIRNLTVEKYASVAQKGAIHAGKAVGWVVENCELRLNSGAGLATGTGSRVRRCDIHHNGQLGIGGGGDDVLIESNRVWANNVRGFSSRWEAGGVKLALGDGIIFRGNHIYDNIGPGLWCDINCRNALYEDNVVERNYGPGLFHEISFSAVIRNNIVRHNAVDGWGWFWDDDILIAASESVDVYGNKLTVSPGKCGIMLIDQSRPMEGPMKGGGKYKTRNNKIHDNEMTFEDAACAGGASDAEPGDENFSVITDGNNVFDRNSYRVPLNSGPQRFSWGHQVFGWDEVRQCGFEPSGRLTLY